MGRDKTRLRLGQHTVLGQIRATARQLQQPVRVIRHDLKPGCGPLGGIFTALKTSRSQAVLFLAADMPFVSASLLRKMLGYLNPGRNALFVREREGVGFPILLRRTALPVVTQQLMRGDLSLQALARVLNARTVRLPRAMSLELFNINTPADWEAARKRSLSSQRKTGKLKAC